MPIFDIFASPRWSPLRMRTKVVSFFILFQELSNKKKVKALRPKMTKIASSGAGGGGGGSCLKPNTICTTPGTYMYFQLTCTLHHAQVPESWSSFTATFCCIQSVGKLPTVCDMCCLDWDCGLLWEARTSHRLCLRCTTELKSEEETEFEQGHAVLMMALTPKRLFLYLCISISLLRPYTLFSRSPLVNKTLFENACELEWVVLYFKERYYLTMLLPCKSGEFSETRLLHTLKGNEERYVTKEVHFTQNATFLTDTTSSTSNLIV